ncbi:hypothetical protein, partial [Arcanobacterium phocae]|uniref:hypothetical protein n=1 Tax=Arcanobacterium phocae TaxID=131112 RepID=UPI001C113846
FQSPAGIALFVAFLYVSVALGIAFLGGWRQLAATYAAESKPLGTTFRNASGWISLFGSYRNCLNVVAASTGIYVETQLPFRLFHRPLLFPWRCVAAIEPKSGGILWPYTKLTVVAGVLKFRLHLPEGAISELQSHVSHETNVA